MQGTQERRRFLKFAGAVGMGLLSGCSTVERITGPSVKEADAVESDLRTGETLLEHAPNVGPQVYQGRELEVGAGRSESAPEDVYAGASDVRYSIDLEPTNYRKITGRRKFLGKTPEFTTDGYDVYTTGMYDAVSKRGRIQADAKQVDLSTEELFERCLDAVRGDDSLLTNQDVRTLATRVQAEHRLQLFLLTSGRYRDERMRVPGSIATAIGDSHLDESTTRREVAGLFSSDEIDPSEFKNWVASTIAPTVQTIPTVVRDGRVMRAYWENTRRATPTPADPSEMNVWAVATENGWRFWYPDEELEPQKELVLPANRRIFLEATSQIDIVQLEIPGLNLRVDAVPHTFSGGLIRPAEPAEHSVTCMGPCRWEYPGEFTTTCRIVPRDEYRQWVHASG